MGGGGSRSSGGSSNRGSLGDGGGRAANNGGMSGGSSSTGSRGGSRGSSNNSASPGRSTPGSPSAADGNRGSTMGAGGGSAPSTGSSSGGGGGNRASPGRSTPGSPNASDGNRGSTMGPDGGSAPGVGGSSGSGGAAPSPDMGYVRNADNGAVTNTDGGYVMTPGGFSTPSANNNAGSFGSSSGGSESIRGSRAASFSFNSPNAGQMASFRSDRQADRSLDGVRSFGLNGTDQGGVASGTIASGESLDTTTPGYRAVVGDGELSDSERAKEARMAQLDGQPVPDTISAQQDAADNVTTRFADRTKMPGVGIVQAGLAIGRNAMLGREVAAENNAMLANRNLSPATLNADAADISAAYNSASLSETTGGLLGNAMAPGMAAVGDYSAPTPNAPRGGDSSSSGLEEELPPPVPRVEGPQPQPPAAGNSRYGGRLTNYGSYRRRFRRALAPRV